MVRVGYMERNPRFRAVERRVWPGAKVKIQEEEHGSPEKKTVEKPNPHAQGRMGRQDPAGHDAGVSGMWRSAPAAPRMSFLW